jgi:NADP-dependent 3-hydroxy acid dehydrogenase YdfG
MSASTLGPVLVTGCSSGIGKATALHLRQQGMTVYATARKVDTLQELAAAGCEVLSLDVNDEQSMSAAVATIEAKYGAVGVLINNAGYSQSGAVEAVPLAKVRAQFETNVFGLIRMTQLVLPGMRRQRVGKIINLSSMGGKFTFPGGGIYHATKHAVESLSDALRFEVRGFGVSVVIVEPGLIRSGFSEAAVSQMPTNSDVDRVYASFHASVARSTKESYEKGMTALLAGESMDVAKTIERAIRAKRPKVRYTVSASATVLMTQKAMMTDSMWDFFCRQNFPTPTP